MKKLFRTVMMLSVASLAVLSSCKKDDASVADATIDINAKIGTTAINDGSTVSTGDVVKFTIISTGNSDNKLKSITMTSTAGGTALLTEDLSGTSSTNTVDFTVASALKGSTVSFTVTLTSGKGSVTKSFKLTVAGTISASPNAIPLFAQSNGDGTARFMSLSSPLSLYTLDDYEANISKIDLAFFFGSTKKASLTSPKDNDLQTAIYSALNWTGARATGLFKTTLTEANYDAIVSSNSDAGIISAASSATYGTAVNNLAAGNVLSFKTQEGKLGLILVTKITGSAGTDGQIEIKVVYQD